VSEIVTLYPCIAVFRACLSVYSRIHPCAHPCDPYILVISLPVHIPFLPLSLSLSLSVRLVHVVLGPLVKLCGVCDCDCGSLTDDRMAQSLLYVQDPCLEGTLPLPDHVCNLVHVWSSGGHHFVLGDLDLLGREAHHYATRRSTRSCRENTQVP
jgi:hypothetical protein